MNFKTFQSVILENGSIDADVVVIAMGAWSGIVKNFFPLQGLHTFSGQALFTII